MRRIVFFTLCLFIVFSAFSQQPLTIEGRVIAPGGDPLFPATVQVKGKTLGVATDIDGYFQLEKVVAGDTLQVRYVGYLSQEIPVQGRTFMAITLRPSEALLDQIVVTGYKVEKKSEVTGAISTIKGENIQNNQSLSLEKLIQGQAAGLLVQGNNGLPGGEALVLIRGISTLNSGVSPLYIVDGVPVDPYMLSVGGLSLSPFTFLNPEDIESVEVLKDAASASIYGAQAANGVILITTKKGNKGKTRFNVSTYQGLSTPLKELELMNSQELARFRILQYENDARMRGFSSPVGRGIWYGLQNTGFDFSPYGITSFSDVEENIPPEDIDRYIEDLPTYDWFGVPYRQGRVQNYQLSASGGSESTQFFTSFNYNSTEAQIENAGLQQAQFRVNIDHQASPKLQISTRISLSSNRQRAFQWNWNGVSPIQSGTTYPWNPIFDEEGNYQEPLLGKPFHPLKHIDLNTIFGTNNQLLGGFSLEYRLFSQLKYKGAFGLDYYGYTWELWFDPRTYIGQFSDGWRSLVHAEKVNNTTTHLLEFTPAIGQDHHFNALLVWEYRHQKSRDSDGTGENFPNELFRTLDAAGNPVTVMESSSAFKYLGTLLNLKYGWQDRYYLNGSLRYDGSSRFGEAHRFGWFPSFSASWRISEEGFFDSGLIDQLKLRVGWGVTGNSLIGDFAARGLAVAGGSYLSNTAIYLSQLANSELSWEQQKEWNIGLDYGLLDQRLNGSVELYRRITSDILLNRDLVPSSGYYSIKENLGRLLNRGLEFSLQATVLDWQGLRWENRFNIAFQHQELLELYSDRQNEGTSFQVGEALWSWYTYDYAGVNPANGRPMWYDHDGNLTYNPQSGDYIGAPNDDRRVFKPDNPNIFGGLNSALSFGGFTLSAFFNFEFGKMGWESLDNYYVDTNNPNTNHLRELWEEAWLEPGDLARWPRPGNGPAPGFAKNFASMTIQKIDYIRLKELNLSYHFPARWLRKWNIDQARIFIQGTNLVTFTGYTGLDPEFFWGYSNANYPNAKVYTAGLEIGF